MPSPYPYYLWMLEIKEFFNPKGELQIDCIKITSFLKYLQIQTRKFINKSSF